MQKFSTDFNGRGKIMLIRFITAVVLGVFLLISNRSYAQSTGQMECEDVCYYTPVNISASSLKNKIRIEIYKTAEPLYPDVLQVSSDDNQLIFYAEDAKKMSSIKRRIVALDKKAKFIKNVGGQAMILIQIHAVETQGIDQFRFAWEGSYDKNRSSGTLPRFTASPTNQGSYKIDFNFGNLASSLFKFAFDFSKTKAWTHKAASWTVFKRSEEDLSVSNNTTLYRESSKSITTDKESAGFSAYGKVFISENNLIKIKNFNLGYSQRTGELNSLVSNFSLSNMSFDLEPGKTRFLALNKVYMKTNSDKESLFFFQDKVADSTEVNLLFSISADLADDNKDIPSESTGLTNDFILSLPHGHNYADILNKIIPTKTEGSILDIFGKKTGLMLERGLLTQENYDRYLKVRIINPAFDNLVVLEQKIQVQDLVNKPLLYNFVDDFDKRCKQNSKQCLTSKVILEIGYDKDRELDLQQIPNMKFILIDDPGYKIQKIIPYDEKLVTMPSTKKSFWGGDEN